MLTDYHLHLRPDDRDAQRRRVLHRGQRRALPRRGRASAGSPSSASPSTSTASRRRSRSGATRSGRATRTTTSTSTARSCASRPTCGSGIEADFVPGAEDRIASLLEARDFDYVVGSVHFLREGAVDMDDYSVWDTRPQPPRQIWRRYFETLGEAAAQRPVRHPRPPRPREDTGARARRPRRPRATCAATTSPRVEAIAESGIAVEVSTAGLRKPVGEIYPAPAFLEMCLEAGAPVALSSDAHRPEDVGADYEQALELLDELGVARAVRVRAARAPPRADRRADAGGARDAHRHRLRLAPPRRRAAAGARRRRDPARAAASTGTPTPTCSRTP